VKRDLHELEGERFDLVVIGGGISGVAAAWDAALRGLSVALLEQNDFAHAASANCFKMIHGGIRYLQHADLIRARQSAAERSAFLRIAPHLSRPLPIFVPTHGHGMKSKEVLFAGMKAYDLLTFDRNRGIPDATRRIPPTRTLSRRQALELYPFLDGPGFTGGAVFHDGQMHSPARLALAFLLSAVARGARAANYAEVTGLLASGDRVEGVRVRDALDDREYEVRGRVVLNATGGWTPRFMGRTAPQAPPLPLTFSRDACFVVRKPLPGEHALAVSGSTRDPDAIFSRDARHLFLVPWRGCTLVGVWHKVWEADPGEASVGEEELATWLAEANAACPGFGLSREDVTLTQCGLVLFGENQTGGKDLSYGKRSLLVDHARTGGPDGLVTLIDVRYTTARADAERAVRLACQKLGRPADRSRTATVPLHGGDIEDYDALERQALAGRPDGTSPEGVSAVVVNHGSAYPQVLALLDADPSLRETLAGSDTLRAAVVHAVREEMALRLEDVLFRRTDLGSGGHPGAEALGEAADLMAAELGWDDSRKQKEVQRAHAAFPEAHPA
jgi:glycerol-3-phosphate dehydrogenase